MKAVYFIRMTKSDKLGVSESSPETDVMYGEMVGDAAQTFGMLLSEVHYVACPLHALVPYPCPMPYDMPHRIPHVAPCSSKLRPSLTCKVCAHMFNTYTTPT